MYYTYLNVNPSLQTVEFSPVVPLPFRQVILQVFLYIYLWFYFPFEKYELYMCTKATDPHLYNML